MNRTDLKVIHDKLTFAWQSECNSSDLCKLSDQELSLFMDGLKEIHKQTHDPLPKDSNDIEKGIIKKLRVNAGKNAIFLLNDLLDLRQEKIIESCRKLDLIDVSLLTSAETEFYQNIMSAFKGYRKMRNIYSVLADSCTQDTLTENSSDYCETDEIELDRTEPPKEIEYILMRVIEEIPTLVGYDFVIYGPFKKEEMGVIPKVNASILEKENLIEIIS